jgi:RimJ/RimL family protein N-acetyltransferase
MRDAKTHCSMGADQDAMHRATKANERFRPVDVGEMVDALAPLELYRFTGGEPPSLGGLRARFCRQSRGHSDDGQSGWLNWIIRSIDSNNAIGFIQATLIGERAAPVTDVAWLVTPTRQGRGAATESAAAVVSWLPPFGVHIIRAFIHPDNVASERVAGRLGLVRTSTVADGEALWESSAHNAALTQNPSDRGSPAQSRSHHSDSEPSRKGFIAIFERFFDFPDRRWPSDSGDSKG